MIVLVALGFLMIVLFEAPGLVKKKYWKELIVFGVLLMIGFALSAQLIFNKDLPPIGTSLTNFFKTYFKPVFEALKI